MANKIIGINLVDKIAPFTDADEFPTHEDIYGKGGYVSLSGFPTAFDALTAGKGIPYGEKGSGRQKIGQIVYDQQTNTHYQINTLGYTLSGPFQLKKTMPYEYGASSKSTSFAAKNANNIIVTGAGQIVAGQIVSTDMYENCAILAGSDNKLFDIQQLYLTRIFNSTVVGGSGNNIWLASWSSIGGGAQNTIYPGTFYSNIQGGLGNNILGQKNYSFIGGGYNNSVGQGISLGRWSSIVGGDRNTTASDYSFIGGGLLNKVFGARSLVVGGQNNEASGIGDSVTGGINNKTYAAAEAGSILFSKGYNDVELNYALDTKLFRFRNTFIESIPGKRHSSLNGAGTIYLYNYNNNFNEALTGREIVQTIVSPAPVLSGRFGHFISIIKNNVSTETGKVENHLVISEPGANKVYLYSINIDRPSDPVSLIQTINLANIDSGAPTNSEFGYSCFFNNTFIGNTNIFGLLAVGAPGYDRAYIFKTNAANPALSSNLQSNPLTLVDVLTGQTKSRFGESVNVGVYSPRNQNLSNTIAGSAACVLVGAPEYTNTSNISSGSVHAYMGFLQSNSTLTAKNYTTFTQFNSTDNSFLFGNLRPGDRFGSSALINGIISIAEGATGYMNGVDLNDLIPQSSITSPFTLSAYCILYYVNTPNKDIVYLFKEDQNSILTDQTFTTDLNFNFSPSEIESGYRTITAYQGGYSNGATMLSFDNYLKAPVTNRGYGAFSILGQQGFVPTACFGPNNDTSGLYSLRSILTATNFNTVPGDDIGVYQIDTDSDKRYNSRFLSKKRNYDGITGYNHPGIVSTYLGPEGPGTHNLLFSPFPPGDINSIQNYGFTNYKWNGTELSPGLATFYYISGGRLTYSNFSLDLPGEVATSSSILGGNNNEIKSKTSLILAGNSNKVETQAVRSVIFGGSENKIFNSTNTGVATVNAIIGTGEKNEVDGSSNAGILLGTNNKINKFSDFSLILGGKNNIVNQKVENSYVLGSNIVAVSSNTTYVENLVAAEHLRAKTKSFYIDHPTKPGKKLQYSSLESPYHGVRLTGENTIVNNKCEVLLPEYISSLVYYRDINIQVTPIGEPVVLYVDNIDIYKNKFKVKTSGFKNYFKTIKFFWSFTGIRKDVEKLVVEE